MDHRDVASGLARCPVSDAPSVGAGQAPQLTRDDLLEGLNALPQSNAGPRPLRGLFCGELRNTATHASYVRLSRAKQITDREKAAVSAGHKQTDAAWNSKRLRYGDKVGPVLEAEQHGAKDGKAFVHPNQWDPQGVISLAWSCAGANKNDRSGIDGQHRNESILSTVACAMQRTQESFVAGRIKYVETHGCIPFLLRHYDATPKRLRFGRLQAELAPHARYAIPCGERQDQWRVVTYEEYAKTRRDVRSIRFGILECLAQGHFLHWTEPGGDWGSMSIICSPQVLTSATGSTIYRAVDHRVPGLDPASLRDLCSRVPFMWYAEMPDACAANRRKKAKTLQEHADIDNLFDVSPPECLCHGLHNTVARTEKQHIGDLHAIQVTCCHVKFQNLMQGRLGTIVRSASFVYGSPDPEAMAHNRKVLKISLLGPQVNSGAVTVQDKKLLDLDRLIDANPLLLRLLRLFNTPWTSLTPGHVCSGLDCCASDSDCKDQMLALLLDSQVDITMAQDVGVSIDDWGSGLVAASKALFGILCHRLLPQSLTLALPSWAAMDVAAPVEEADNEAATIARIRIRKKAWRARCVLTDAVRMMHLCIFAVVGAPVQQCMLRVDSLDERGDAILDCMDPESSPFVACRRELRNIVHYGCGEHDRAVLRPIFTSFLNDEEVNLTDAFDLARTMAQEFSVQNYFKTIFLSDLLFSLFKVVHPKPSVAEKEKPVADLFSSRPCCRGRAGSDKIYKHFKTSLRLAAHKRFWESLRHVARRLKIANMWSERLLARTQKATSQGHKVDVETACSKGFLVEVLREHTSLGHLYPGILHREQLIADGVPLRRVRQKGRTRASSGFFVFKGECERRRHDSYVSELEQRQCLLDLSSQWKAMSEKEKAPYKAKAIADYAVRVQEMEEDAKEDVPAAKAASDTFISECGDERSPFGVEHFANDIRQLLGSDADAAIPGFVSYAEKYREEWLRRILVSDQGDIDPSEVFNYRLPCGLAHPGFCVGADSSIVEGVYSCAKNFQFYFEHKPRGSIHTVFFERDDGTVTRAHVTRAHFRGGGPRCILLISYVEDEVANDSNCLHAAEDRMLWKTT